MTTYLTSTMIDLNVAGVETIYSVSQWINEPQTKVTEVIIDMPESQDELGMLIIKSCGVILLARTCLGGNKSIIMDSIQPEIQIKFIPAGISDLPEEVGEKERLMLARLFFRGLAQCLEVFENIFDRNDELQLKGDIQIQSKQCHAETTDPYLVRKDITWLSQQRQRFNLMDSMGMVSTKNLSIVHFISKILEGSNFNIKEKEGVDIYELKMSMRDIIQISKARLSKRKGN